MIENESIPLWDGRNSPCAYVEYTYNVRSHAECLRRHPISECSASTPDRRRRPGSAPGPPAPALRQFGPGPPPARSSSISESSEQLPSIAPRWPHSESLGPECATTWPASRWRVALRSSIAGVACRRARSESVSASCAMVGWALSIGLIDLPFSHWTHVTFKHPSRIQNGKAGAQSDRHIFAIDGLPLQPSDPVWTLEITDSAQT